MMNENLFKLYDLAISGQNLGVNELFRGIKNFCLARQKDNFLWSRRLLEINKEELIIFEAKLEDLKSVDIDPNRKGEYKLPFDRTFVEIPKWKIKTKEYEATNLGGILFFKEILGERILYTAYSMWVMLNNKTDRIALKPFSVSFFEGITNDSISNDCL